MTAQCRKATIGDEKRVERYPKALAMLARIPTVHLLDAYDDTLPDIAFWMLSAWNWTLADMLGCKVDLIEEGTSEAAGSESVVARGRLRAFERAAL